MARRWLRPPQSVRVRITLAAVVVTAVALGTAGWLLVRSVEDAQVRDIRNDISAFLDVVTRRLAEGQSPQRALAATDGAPRPAQVTVTDERRQIVQRVTRWRSPTSSSVGGRGGW
jgi:Flp pilus assembly protein TadB